MNMTSSPVHCHSIKTQNLEGSKCKKLKLQSPVQQINSRTKLRRSVAMACTNCLHSSTISHATFPTTNHRRNSPVTTFRPTTSSYVRQLFSSNHQFRPPAMVVQAQAKRGFLPKIEVETASRKFLIHTLISIKISYSIYQYEG